MSDTARLALTLVCWLLAGAAEVTGIALLAKEARASRRAVARWRERRDSAPEPSAGLEDVEDVLDQLLGNRFDRAAAVGLLALGVVVGSIGNFLGL
jgi:hypothetical protein